MQLLYMKLARWRIWKEKKGSQKILTATATERCVKTINLNNGLVSVLMITLLVSYKDYVMEVI